jgi:hypothetical protein
MNRLTLSVALVGLILLSLMASDSTAKAQQAREKFTVDTGLIVPGPHQILRITVAGGSGNDKLTFVRFRRIEYTPGPCNGDGVCQDVISSQTITNRISLAPGEAAVFDVTDGSSNTTLRVRGVVESSKPDVTVAAQIIGPNGEVTSHIIMANTEGDFH